MFLISWLAFAAMAAVWSLATPTLGAADEPAHVIKAAAVVRGQWVGTNVGHGISAETSVRLPTPYASLDAQASCYAHKTETPASCAPTLPQTSGSRDATTSAGRYPPLYYLLTGWPSLMWPAHLALPAMRLASAVLAGLFLAGAITIAVIRGRAVLAFGTGIAATPQVLFFAGVENPNGFEVAVAALVWVCGILLIVDRPPPPIATRLLTLLAIALAVLVLVRSISPLWALTVMVLLAIAGDPAQLLWLLRLRRTYALAAPVVGATLLAVAWTFTEHALVVLPNARLPGQSIGTSILGMRMRTPEYFSEMVGNLGWLDTPVPHPVLLSWYAAVGVLLVLALVVGSPRLRLSLLATLAAVIVLPIAISAPEVPKLGYIWQGRYTLPLAVGLPLLAAFALDQRRDLLRMFRPAIIAGAAILGLAEITTVWTALHRWADGANGPLDIFAARWQALGSTAFVMVFAVVVIVGFWSWQVHLTGIAGRLGEQAVDQAPSAAIPAGTPAPSQPT